MSIGLEVFYCIFLLLRRLKNGEGNIIEMQKV